MLWTMPCLITKQWTLLEEKVENIMNIANLFCGILSLYVFLNLERNIFTTILTLAALTNLLISNLIKTNDVSINMSIKKHRILNYT